VSQGRAHLGLRHVQGCNSGAGMAWTVFYSLDLFIITFKHGHTTVGDEKLGDHHDMQQRASSHIGFPPRSGSLIIVLELQGACAINFELHSSLRLKVTDNLPFLQGNYVLVPL